MCYARLMLNARMLLCQNYVQGSTPCDHYGGFHRTYYKYLCLWPFPLSLTVLLHRSTCNQTRKFHLTYIYCILSCYLLLLEYVATFIIFPTEK